MGELAMDLRQLRSFVHVADLRSLTRAAGFLGVSQPALSRQIRLLEEGLGTKLFHRNGQGVSLTAAGALLLERSTRVLGEIENIRGEMRAYVCGAGPTGTVGVGVPVAVSPLLADPFLEKCRTIYPDISVRLVEGFSALLHEWLQTGSIDLSFLYGPRPSGVIESKRLLIEDLYAIGPATPEAEALTSLTPTVLAKSPLILPHRPHIIRELVHQTGIQPVSIIEVDAPGIMIELAHAGRGYAILPLTCVTIHVAAGFVRAIPIQHPSISWTATLSYSKLRPLSPAARAIFKLICDEVGGLVQSGRWPARLVTS
jgi:LysR family nitrogen assimilation transcriptional regulator